MSEQRTAFDKWFDDYEHNNDIRLAINYGAYEIAGDAWQAATAEANKRIAEIEGEVANLRLNIKAQEQLGYEFQASNNDLREALETCEEEKVYNGFSYEIQKTFNSEKVKKAISATPAESLQAFENEVLERAATELEKEEEYGYYHACIVRALKLEVK